MAKLINDLMDYSRLSSSVLPEKIQLSNIIEEVLSDLEYLIDEKGALINTNDFPEVIGVPSQLRQVFQNLIGNALKFSKTDLSPLIEIHSEIIASKDFESEIDPNGRFCRITVKDNGIGFDERYLDKIFVIFQSLNDRAAYEGTGIGLAIAKKIIEKHNGLITAKSQIGLGSSFIIILPLKH